MDAARCAFSSRAGPVKPRSVSGCAAVLYSSRWAASKPTPSLSSARTEKQLLDRDAGEPEAAGRLQVDLVERGGQVVGQVAAAELPERFGPGVRGLARRAELASIASRSSCTVARPMCWPPTLATSALTRGSCLGPPQAVEHVGEPRPVPGQQRGHRVGRRPLRDALGQIQLEDERRVSAAGAAW